MQQEKICEVVTVHTDEQLLSLLRRCKKFRTYPAARDRHQVALHGKMLQLKERGKVTFVRDAGSSWEWAAS